MGAPKRRNIETPEVREIWFQFQQQQYNRKDSKGKRGIETKSLSSATVTTKAPGRINTTTFVSNNTNLQ